MRSPLAARQKRERLFRKYGVLSLIIGMVVLVFWVQGLLLSVIIAFVLNYLIAPFVLRLERRGVHHNIAVLIPFLSLIGGLALLIWNIAPFIVDQIAVLEKQLPTYQQELLVLVHRIESRFYGVLQFYKIDVAVTINQWVIAKTSDLSSSIPSYFSQAMTVFALAPFFAFFMLKDGRQLAKKVISLLPNDLFELSLRLHHKINDQLGGFIRARFLEAAIVGVVVLLGLEILHFPYASLLALFAGITNLIPYIGPIIGAAPAVILALLPSQGQDTTNLFLLIGVFTVAQVIDMFFVIPLVVARIVNLHPVVVVLVIIVGAQMMGILGMIISIPVTSVLKLTVQAFYEHLSD